MGGSNEPKNIAFLTAREHFLAHWILFKLYKNSKTAMAFRLLCDTNKHRRGRDYEASKVIYAKAMLGDNNPAKREDVKLKIRAALKASHPFKGKKRPEHSAFMKGRFVGSTNPAFGSGERQRGEKNHSARAVSGVNGVVVRRWATLMEASIDLGVSIQAVCQSIKKKRRSRGWTLEYTNGL
jgi:hypothetical protein